MCATAVTANVWHLSVLNLLPFSKNDAVSVSHDSNQTSVAMSHQSFPVLSVSMPYLQQDSSRNNASSSNSSHSSSTTYSSRTANGINKKVVSTAIQTQPRRLSRRHEVKSQNECFFRESKECDSTHFVFNGNGHLGRASMGDSSKSDGSTSLPKPVFKPTECWKLRDFKRRVYQSGYGDKGLEKQTRIVDLDQSSKLQHSSRRLKVNVKELPRSRTPIADNDPDKLNMNQVIAFLQANTVVTGGECHGRNGNGAEQVSSADPAQVASSENPEQLSKRLALNSALPHARRKDAIFDQQHQIIKYSPSRNNPINATAVEKPKVMSPDMYSSSRRTSYNSESSTNTITNRSSESPYRHSSPSEHSRGGVIYQHGSKVIRVDTSRDLGKNEKQISIDKRQVNLKAIDKQMYSEKFNSQKSSMEISYRLNRFLGGEKDGSKSVVIIPSGLQDRRGVGGAKEVIEGTPSVKHTDLHTCSNKLPSVRHNNGRIIYRQAIRSDPTFSRTSSTENEPTLNNDKVICLPTAQLEADSEEESMLPSNVDKVQGKIHPTLPSNIDKVQGKIHPTLPSNVDRVQTKSKATFPDKDGDIIKAGKTPSAEDNSSPNTVLHCFNFSDPEPIQDNTNSINIENTVVNEKTDDLLNFQTVNTKLNELSNRLAEEPIILPAQPLITVADITRDRTPQVVKLITPQPDVTPLFKFLNYDLATVSRTRHWLENHNKLFPPVIDKHAQTDECQVSTRSSEQIRLSLRKERNKTRVHTYMTDMGEQHDGQ